MTGKKLKWSLLFVTVTTLQGCFTNNSEKRESSSYEGVKGSYIYGHEVNSFKPCGTTAELWVVGEQNIMTKLENDYMRLTNKPYEEVFVSFKGKKLPKASDGFADDYLGQFQVIGVEVVQKESLCL